MAVFPHATPQNSESQKLHCFWAWESTTGVLLNDEEKTTRNQRINNSSKPKEEKKEEFLKKWQNGAKENTYKV